MLGLMRICTAHALLHEPSPTTDAAPCFVCEYSYFSAEYIKDKLDATAASGGVAALISIRTYGAPRIEPADQQLH